MTVFTRATTTRVSAWLGWLADELDHTANIGKIQQAMREEAERQRMMEDRVIGEPESPLRRTITPVCSNCGEAWDDPLVQHGEFGCRSAPR